MSRKIMSKRLLSAFVAAGLGLGVSTVMAQNVDSDKDRAQGQEQTMRDKEQAGGQSQGQAGTMRTYNESGERQIGLEQYQMEQQRCSAGAADAREDCLHLARVRYEGWAIMQCQLMAGVGQKRCYQNIQAAVSSKPVTTGTTGQNAGRPGSNASPETGAVRRNEDRQ